MSLLSGGEGIRSAVFSVFVPCSFTVWDAVLFSYVRKAVNSPKMDRSLANTYPVSHRSVLSPHRRTRRCREQPTPEWLRTSKRQPHRNHSLVKAVRNDHLTGDIWLQLGKKLDGKWRGHASRTLFCDRLFWRIFIVHFWTNLNIAEHNRLSNPSWISDKVTKVSEWFLVVNQTFPIFHWPSWLSFAKWCNSKQCVHANF